VNPARSSGDVVSTWGVGVKGFKGKGDQAEAWARQAHARLDEIHGAMRALARETRAVGGHDFTLVVHTRGRNGQLTLRWRLAGRPARHVTWAALASLVDSLPPALGQWYRRAHGAALLLNHQEMAMRHELRLAERCREEARLANLDQEQAHAPARGSPS
jgi:hypothetical protein